MPESADSRAALAARLYQSGQTRDEVAKRFGVRGDVVTQWLDGVARRRGARRRADVTDELILHLRDEDHLSWPEIARETGMSRTGVRMRYLAAHGIPRPERAKNRESRE
jgi:transposase-like protein